jgi:hypothetical protein
MPDPDPVCEDVPDSCSCRTTTCRLTRRGSPVRSVCEQQATLDTGKHAG